MVETAMETQCNVHIVTGKSVLNGFYWGAKLRRYCVLIKAHHTQDTPSDKMPHPWLILSIESVYFLLVTLLYFRVYQ